MTPRSIGNRSEFQALGAVSCLALALGCSGLIGEPGGGPANGSPNAAGAGSGAGAGGSQLPDVPLNASCGDTPSAAATPMRRLTQAEYNASARELLGDSTAPASTFVTDESIGGFASNNISPVSVKHVEDYSRAGEALAKSADLGRLFSCDPQGEGEASCAERFVRDAGRLLFRRDLDATEVSRYVAAFAEKRARSGYEAGLRHVLNAFLQSPHFLYRPEVDLTRKNGEFAALNGYELATRLSFFMFGATPDKALLNVAASGALDTVGSLETTVRQMLSDPRLADGVRSFHRQWLRLDALESLDKDSVIYPEFSQALKLSMEQETLRFADHLFQSAGSLTELFTASYSFLDAPLAALYGVVAPDVAWARVDLPAGQRAGLLTHPSLMSVTSLAADASPILRGKFVRTRLLCQVIPEPPSSVDITPPNVDPTLSTKQRFEQHRDDPSCSGCHQLMDPIGFGFQHYDAIGRYQERDGNFAVDATGELKFTADADGAFDGALALGQRLAGSQEVQACVSKQWLRYALGRPERTEESCAVDSVLKGLQAGQLSLKELVVQVTLSDAFRFRKH